MRRIAILLAVGAVAAAPRSSAAQAQAVDLFRLGAKELAAGQVDKAIESFEKGVQLRSDAKEGWYNLGVAYGRKKVYAKEIQAYQKALELDPNYANALHNLGLAYLDLGQKDKAVETLTKAAKVDPAAGDAWNNLGVSLLGKGDNAGAADAFRKAAEVAPGSAESRFNLGIALLRLADAEGSTERRDPILRQAQKADDDALALDAKYHRAAYNKAAVLHRLRDRDGEVAAYRSAIAIKPDYGPALYNLGAALSAGGDKDAAVKAWEDYVKAAGADPAEKPFVDNARKEIARLQAL